MARPRSRAPNLLRLLHAARQPVYVLDDLGTLVFVNQACQEWLGQPEKSLLGLRCAYHSVPDVPPAAALAAGLCPPPEVFEGTCESACVHCGEETRRARFFCLGDDPRQRIGVLAIVDAQPAAADAAPSPIEPSPPELHALLHRFRRQLAARYRGEILVGESPAARRIRAQVQMASQGRASVLICGPSGSGRQHVAGTIHYAGDPQQAGALVPLACSVLSPDLVASTVHALAARHPEDVEVACGTLLLNDVDHLAPEAQQLLADVLSARPFPMRLAATSRRELVEWSRRGEFLESLACLLSTIVIELPPLAQRREDLPWMAQFFLEEINARGAKQLSGFTPEALDRLHAHAWAGNCDELSAVVAEAHARAAGPLVAAADLPPRLRLAAEEPGHARRKDEPIVLDEYLGRIERELIRRALERAKGNKAKAARLLGLTRPRLYRRLVQLKMIEE